jgi:hypothetical protein
MPTETQQSRITRFQIARNVMDAFQVGSAGREELVAAAQLDGAAPEVVALLESLPDRSYSNIRMIWNDLPELPVR